MAQLNLNKKPGESDRAYYVRLSKVADQRLVRLEALSYEKGFRSVKDWAYAGAIKDIQRYTPGGTRFNVKVNDKYLQDRIVDVKRFLEKPSSSKSQIKKFYQKRANTLNKSQGTNYTWQELADFFENQKADKLFHEYGSGDTLRVYNAINKGTISVGQPVEGETKKQRINREMRELNEALKKGNVEQVLHVDDKHVKNTIIDMLVNNNINPKEVFKN